MTMCFLAQYSARGRLGMRGWRSIWLTAGTTPVSRMMPSSWRGSCQPPSFFLLSSSRNGGLTCSMEKLETPTDRALDLGSWVTAEQRPTLAYRETEARL